MTTAIAQWLLTYLIHSTLLLGGVALATHWFVRREAVREALWKGALVGGIVTASVAMVVPRPGPATIRLAALGDGTSQQVDPAAQRSASPAGMPAADGSEGGGPAGVDSEAGAPTSEGDIGAASERAADTGSAGRDVDVAGGVRDEASGETQQESGRAPAWLLVGVLAWLATAGGLLARLGYRHLRLRQLLRGRTQVRGDDPAVSTLTELRRVAGVWKPVRLTSTSLVGTPLALGHVEVCVPERFLTELPAPEQRAALAHELAHLARRDPVWQVAGSIIGAALFFQPLNGLAARRIRAAAEYLADGWAVAHTGSQIELARCLAAVAAWVAPSAEPVLAGTVAMAEGGSPLMARVRRLLEREPERAPRPASQVAIAVGLVAVTAAFAPAVGPRPGAAGADDAAARAVGPTSEPVVPGPELGPQRSLEVDRLDRPGRDGDGLVARLNEAGRAAGSSSYWVAYAVPAIRGGRDALVESDSWEGLDVNGPSIARQLGVEQELAPGQALMLVRLVPTGAATRVDRMSARRPDLGMRIDGVVYWLGAADAAESFRWMRDIYVATRDVSIRETAVDAIGLHATAEAEPFLRTVLKREKAEAVREQAVEGLAEQRPDTAVARLLFDVALNDPDPGVRREATEQLGRIPEPLAVELLERLAWESEAEGVQRQAAESLGEHGGEAARSALARLMADHPAVEVQREAMDQVVEIDGVDGDALLHVAMTADEADMRREAVEMLAELPPDEAIAYLRRAVFESGDGTVERQAAESAGDVGTEAAFDLLMDILRQNPSEDASFQAVESLAQNFPRDRVMPVLREILTSHPSARVRREALDQLGNLGG